MSERSDNSTQRNDSGTAKAPDKQDGTAANREARGDLKPGDGAAGGQKPEGGDGRLPEKAQAAGAGPVKSPEVRPELGGIDKIAPKVAGELVEDLKGAAAKLGKAGGELVDGAKSAAKKVETVVTAKVEENKQTLSKAGDTAVATAKGAKDTADTAYKEVKSAVTTGADGVAKAAKHGADAVTKSDSVGHAAKGLKEAGKEGGRAVDQAAKEIGAAKDHVGDSAKKFEKDAYTAAGKTDTGQKLKELGATPLGRVAAGVAEGHLKGGEQVRKAVERMTSPGTADTASRGAGIVKDYLLYDKDPLGGAKTALQDYVKKLETASSPAEQRRMVVEDATKKFWFSETNDHITKAETALKKGDVGEGISEYIQAEASFGIKVVELALIIKGANEAFGPRPAGSLPQGGGPKVPPVEAGGGPKGPVDPVAPTVRAPEVVDPTAPTQRAPEVVDPTAPTVRAPEVVGPKAPVEGPPGGGDPAPSAPAPDTVPDTKRGLGPEERAPDTVPDTKRSPGQERIPEARSGQTKPGIGPRELSPDEAARIGQRMGELMESGRAYEVGPDGRMGYTKEYAELRRAVNEHVQAKVARLAPETSTHAGRGSSDPAGYGRPVESPDAGGRSAEATRPGIGSPPPARPPIDVGPSVRQADQALRQVETRMGELDRGEMKYRDNTRTPEYAKAEAAGDQVRMERLEAADKKVADNTLTPEYERALADREAAMWNKLEALEQMYRDRGVIRPRGN